MKTNKTNKKRKKAKKRRKKKKKRRRKRKKKHMPGEIEEKHENLQPGQTVSGDRDSIVTRSFGRISSPGTA
jgi:hypothetical protein